MLIPTPDCYQNNLQSSHQIFTLDCQQQLHKGMAWLPPSGNWIVLLISGNFAVSWARVLAPWQHMRWTTCASSSLRACWPRSAAHALDPPMCPPLCGCGGERGNGVSKADVCRLCILMMGYIIHQEVIRARAAWSFHGSYMTGKVEYTR